jgi:soluble lytic murein transglycosylase
MRRRPPNLGLIGLALLLAASVSADAQTAAPQSSGKPAAKAGASTGANPTAKRAAAPQVASGLPAIASPQATPEEAQHVARLDAAIAPAREHAVSAEDAHRIKEAVAAFAANDQAKARALAAQIADPIGRKLVDWFRLKVGTGEAAEYRAFLEQNPAWPERRLLIQRLEEALFSQGGSAQSIKSYFASADPQTGIGLAALASAFLAEGNESAAAEIARKAWRGRDLPATFETGFLERFARFLTEADHKWRLDRLIVEDIRWTNERAERVGFARRLIPHLSAAEQKKAEARLAVFRKAANAQALIDALPAGAGDKPDWGLAYHRIQVLRRAGSDEAAAKLMLTVPVDPESVANLDQWWEERRALAYAALRGGRARLAYEVAKTAGPVGVNALKDQQFMAGWLAQRFLNDPKTAAVHFAALRRAADGPLSLSKAAYWQGRAAEALGDKAQAMEHYTAGAAYHDTFHGQLARMRLEPAARRLDFPLPGAPSAAEVQAFNGLDSVRAAVIARKSGLEPGIARAFLIHLARIAKTEGETVLVTHLAEALGDTQVAVRIAKLAIGRGHRLYNYSYPLHPMPAYVPLRQPPETALLLAIARQESEFNTLTVSGAGARGILQVMPVTARHVCRDYKVKCDIGRLLTDASYNATIASAYITDRMAEFQGSYVLTFAGYNAGPGRARQWIREFGDPRDPAVDPIDWIFRIPIEETREYVQKVMSNVQVYRVRLGDKAGGLRIGEDLARARSASHGPDPVARPPPADVPADAAGNGAAAVPGLPASRDP